jgi:hypothetical protein
MVPLACASILFVTNAVFFGNGNSTISNGNPQYIFQVTCVDK